jgi:hypothetical protein
MLRAGASAFSASARLFSTAAKRSTGIVGLDVEPNARGVLAALYQRILRDVQVIPAHVPYRVAVEDAARYRLGVVSEIEDVRWPPARRPATPARAPPRRTRAARTPPARARPAHPRIMPRRCSRSS